MHSIGKPDPACGNRWGRRSPRRAALSASPGAPRSACCLLPFLYSLLEARSDEVVEIAVEHRLRVAGLDAGAQVLDARLVEHVAADLVAPADVGLLLLELRLLGAALAQLGLVELRFQHRHRLGAVAVLRAVVLALHDDAGGQVGDAHRAVGAVDVLAASARGAVGVDAQVSGVDLHLERFVDLGIDEHAGEGRMPARIGIERALTHQAVDAGLSTKLAVRIVAVDLQGRALDARHLAAGALQHLDGEAPLVAVLDVHALEHRRPVLRLGAARARLDVDEAVVGVERVGEHAAKLERRDVALQARRLAPDLLERRLVGIGARHVEQLFRVGEAAADAAERADHGLERLLFLAERLRALRVVPQLRVFELAVQRREAALLRLEVKDTSAARPTGSAGRRARRRSGLCVRLPLLAPEFSARRDRSDAPGGIFFRDLVVEKRGRVWSRHELAIHLRVDAAILKDLPVRHLDFERGGLLVVADRAHLRRIDAFALHQPLSVALQGVLAPPASSVPSMLEPFTCPVNSPLRPASLKLRRSPRSFTSSSGTSLPLSTALPETRVSCCLSCSVAGCLLTAGGICTFQRPATLAGTTYNQTIVVWTPEIASFSGRSNCFISSGSHPVRG